MRTILLTAAALLLLSCLALADLCPKCADRMHTMDIGTCKACGGQTSSGAFKLCKACSKKLGQCEACRAPLSAAKAETPAGADAAAARVFLIGDSTVCNYTDERRPLTGWGEKLPGFFDGRVTFVNRAISGQSARLFIESGKWKTLLGEMKKGDYLLIQLGHNDQWPTVKLEKFSHPDTTYQEFLRQYVNESRAAGVIPILVTPVERMTRYDAQGNFHESHYLNIPKGSNLNIPAPKLTYPQAMRKAATETKTPCVDLQARSAELLQKIGMEKGLELYMVFPAGKYPNWPKGGTDREHLCEKGATVYAGLVAQEIVRLKLPLAQFVKPEALAAPATEEAPK